MTFDPLSDRALAVLWQQAERAVAGEERGGQDLEGDDWVALLEFEPWPGDAPIALASLAALVDALSDWDPTSLYTPVRYGIQLRVRAADPLAALYLALVGHEEAARAVAMAALRCVRAEIVPRSESDDCCELAIQDEQQASPRRPLTVVSEEAYRATRGLIAAATGAELTAVLVEFVGAIGAAIHVGPYEVDARQVAVDLGGDHGPPIIAIADSASVAGMLLEQSLPTLVCDAGIARARLSQLEPGPGPA